MMANQPLVSVLIPCYNGARWVAETLDSVFSQTWPRLQVVLVNDGSTDETMDVVQPYQARGLEVIEQRNAGQTASLNRALAAARGDYIQYLDADDLIAANKIELQMLRLMHSPGCIASAQWTRFHSHPQASEFTPLDTWRDMTPVDWLVANWREGGGMMYPAMWLLPRNIVETIGPWREDLTLVNDTEYFTRAVLAARQVLFCDGAKTWYRSGVNGSLSGRKTPQAWRSQFTVTDACESHLLAHERSDRTRRVCSMMWQRLAYAAYPYERALANHALARARALHDANLPPEGGRAFHAIRRVLGWKRARVLQRLSGRP